MPKPVFDALRDHLELERNIGGYEAEAEAGADLAALYTECAALINAAPDEIAFVENATRAWDMAFYGLALGPGDRVLTHASEYASNYLALLHQSRAAASRSNSCRRTSRGRSMWRRWMRWRARTSGLSR